MKKLTIPLILIVFVLSNFFISSVSKSDHKHPISLQMVQALADETSEDGDPFLIDPHPERFYPPLPGYPAPYIYR